MEREVLVQLLKDACRAPSGDNVQPWRFEWDGTRLFIYNIPDIHNPHMDFEERGAYIAHGALIENLIVAAPHYGYEITFKLFPDPLNQDLVADLEFLTSVNADEFLYPAIAERATNRHRYRDRSLTEVERNALRSTVSGMPGTTLHFVENRTQIKSLAFAASRAELVILEDESIAGHFFQNIVWTHEEERERKAGFFVKTMEFTPIQELIFKMASKPRFMRLFRKIGLPVFIANEDAKLYSSGCVIGGVFIKDESRESYIAAGRALQRIWLTATSMNLAFQPLIGMSFIAYKSLTGRGNLHSRHAQEMRQAYEQARSVLGGEDILAFLFRIGEAPKPSVRTSRKDPQIAFV